MSHLLRDLSVNVIVGTLIDIYRSKQQSLRPRVQSIYANFNKAHNLQARLINHCRITNIKSLTSAILSEKLIDIKTSIQ